MEGVVGMSDLQAAGGILLTVEEMAELLRTTSSGIYQMVARQQLPGVIRIGRRVLFDREVVIDWLRHRCSAPSDRSGR
jgi:excisionase family DNA binding protein